MPVFVRASYRRSIYVGMFASRIRLRGLLGVENEVLVLEYREQWRSPANLRTVESPPHRVTVPVASLDEAVVLPRFLGGKWLVLREKTFDALHGWPGAREGRCRLQLADAPGQTALEGGREIALQIAESQLRILESGEEAERG